MSKLAFKKKKTHWCVTFANFCYVNTLPHWFQANVLTISSQNAWTVNHRLSQVHEGRLRHAAASGKHGTGCKSSRSAQKFRSYILKTISFMMSSPFYLEMEREMDFRTEILEESWNTDNTPNRPGISKGNQGPPFFTTQSAEQTCTEWAPSVCLALRLQRWISVVPIL